MTRFLLILYCLTAFANAFAQLPDSSTYRSRFPGEHHDGITLLTGYHQGRYGFGELGLGRNIYGFTHHPYDVGYYLGTEVRMDRPELWGVKVGAYLDGGSAMGIQLIEYFDGADQCTVLRPEIGFGVWKAKVTYAYNWRLTNPRIEGINTHMLSLTYAFRVVRLPGDDDKRSQH